MLFLLKSMETYWKEKLFCNFFNGSASDRLASASAHTLKSITVSRMRLNCFSGFGSGNSFSGRQRHRCNQFTGILAGNMDAGNTPRIFFRCRTPKRGKRKTTCITMNIQRFRCILRQPDRRKLWMREYYRRNTVCTEHSPSAAAVCRRNRDLSQQHQIFSL